MRRLPLAPTLVTLALTLSSAPAVTVINGTFEANAAAYTLWPGYSGGANPASPTGWTIVGGVGINPVVPGGPNDSPFNNGANTGAFAFIQGTANLDQDITGFLLGGNYVLSIDFNARNCCTAGVNPMAEIYLDGTILASSAALFPAPGGVVPSTLPLGNGGVWYHANLPFVAADTTITLSIRTRPDAAAGGDTTLIVDNISIVPEPTIAALALCSLGVGLVRRRRSDGESA